jgi:hypothetical protein
MTRSPPDKILVVWFATSPDAGHPDCLCSACYFVIGEEESALRLWHRTSNGASVEARFCPRCVGYYGMTVLAAAAQETEPG